MEGYDADAGALIEKGSARVRRPERAMRGESSLDDDRATAPPPTRPLARHPAMNSSRWIWSALARADEELDQHPNVDEVALKSSQLHNPLEQAKVMVPVNG